MKKLWIKAVAFCVIASYIFTVSFGFSQSIQSFDKKDQSVIQSAIIENNEDDCSNPHIEYFAAAISKLYNTIASVSKVVNVNM